MFEKSIDKHLFENYNDAMRNKCSRELFGMICSRMEERQNRRQVMEASVLLTTDRDLDREEVKDSKFRHYIRRNIRIRKTSRIRRQKRRRVQFFALMILTAVASFVIGIGRLETEAYHNTSDLKKYYTSVQLQDGDTLWSLARKYNVNTNISHHDYIDEIRRMNQMEGTTVHRGHFLTVFYYK